MSFWLRHCLGGFRSIIPFNPHSTQQGRGRGDFPHSRREEELRGVRCLFSAHTESAAEHVVESWSTLVQIQSSYPEE